MADVIYVSPSGPSSKGDDQLDRKYGIYFGKLFRYLSRVQTEAYSGTQIREEPWERFKARLSETGCRPDAVSVAKSLVDASTTSTKRPATQVYDANGKATLQETLPSMSYAKNLVSSSAQPLLVNVKSVVASENRTNDPVLIVTYKDDTSRVVKGKRGEQGNLEANSIIELSNISSGEDQTDINKMIVVRKFSTDESAANGAPSFFQNIKPLGPDTVFKVDSSFPQRQSVPSSSLSGIRSDVWREGTTCFSNKLGDNHGASNNLGREKQIIPMMGVCPRPYPFFPASKAPFLASLGDNLIFDVKTLTSPYPITVVCKRGVDGLFKLCMVQSSLFPPPNANLQVPRAFAWPPSFIQNDQDVDIGNVVQHRGPFIVGFGEDFIQQKKCFTKAWKWRLNVRDRYISRTGRVFHKSDIGSRLEIKALFEDVLDLKYQTFQFVIRKGEDSKPITRDGIFEKPFEESLDGVTGVITNVEDGMLEIEIDGMTRLRFKNPFFRPNCSLHNLLTFSVDALRRGVRTSDLYSKCTRIVDNGTLSIGVVDGANVISSTTESVEEGVKAVCISSDSKDIPFFIRLRGASGGVDLLCNLKLNDEQAVCSYVRTHDAPVAVTSHLLEQVKYVDDKCQVEGYETHGRTTLLFDDKELSPVPRHPKLNYESASKTTLVARARQDPYPLRFGNVHELDAMVTLRHHIEQQDNTPSIEILANPSVSFKRYVSDENRTNLCTPDALIVLPALEVISNIDAGVQRFFARFSPKFDPSTHFLQSNSGRHCDYTLTNTGGAYEIARHSSTALWPPVFQPRKTLVSFRGGDDESIKLYQPVRSVVGFVEAKSHVGRSMTKVYEKYATQVKFQKKVLNIDNAFIYLMSWSFKGFTQFRLGADDSFSIVGLGKSVVYKDHSPKHNISLENLKRPIMSETEIRVETTDDHYHLVRRLRFTPGLFATPLIQTVSQVKKSNLKNGFLIEYASPSGRASHVLLKFESDEGKGIVKVYDSKQHVLEDYKLKDSDLESSTTPFSTVACSFNADDFDDTGKIKHHDAPTFFEIDLGVTLFRDDEETSMCILSDADAQIKRHMRDLGPLIQLNATNPDNSTWKRWWSDLMMMIALHPSTTRKIIKIDPDLKKIKGFEDAATQSVADFEEMVVDAKCSSRHDSSEEDADHEDDFLWKKSGAPAAGGIIGPETSTIGSLLQRVVRSKGKLEDTIRLKLNGPETFKVYLDSGEFAFYDCTQKDSVKKEDRQLLQNVFQERLRPTFDDPNLERTVHKLTRAMICFNKLP